MVGFDRSDLGRAPESLLVAVPAHRPDPPTSCPSCRSCWPSRWRPTASSGSWPVPWRSTSIPPTATSGRTPCSRWSTSSGVEKKVVGAPGLRLRHRLRHVLQGLRRRPGRVRSGLARGPGAAPPLGRRALRRRPPAGGGGAGARSSPSRRSRRCWPGSSRPAAGTARPFTRSTPPTAPPPWSAVPCTRRTTLPSSTASPGTWTRYPSTHAAQLAVSALERSSRELAEGRDRLPEQDRAFAARRPAHTPFGRIVVAGDGDDRHGDCGDCLALVDLGGRRRLRRFRGSRFRGARQRRSRPRGRRPLPGAAPGAAHPGGQACSGWACSSTWRVTTATRPEAIAQGPGLLRAGPPVGRRRRRHPAAPLQRPGRRLLRHRSARRRRRATTSTTSGATARASAASAAASASWPTAPATTATPPRSTPTSPAGVPGTPASGSPTRTPRAPPTGAAATSPTATPGPAASVRSSIWRGTTPTRPATGPWAPATGSGAGILYDGGGSDRYRSVYYSLASGAHFCLGAVFDDGDGDDTYTVWDPAHRRRPGPPRGWG